MSSGTGSYGSVTPVNKWVVKKEGTIFSREVSTLKRLSGTGLSPEFYSSFLNGDTQYLLLNGKRKRFFKESSIEMENLEDWVELSWLGDDIPPAVSRSFFQKIKQFHCMGFVHGDLHNGNIMVSPSEDEIVFVDFGFSQRNWEAAFYEATYIFRDIYESVDPFTFPEGFSFNYPGEIVWDENVPDKIFTQLKSNLKKVEYLRKEHPFLPCKLLVKVIYNEL